jgi:hypothetical protein
VNTKLIALEVLVLLVVMRSLCFIEDLVSHDMIVLKIAKIQNASIEYNSIKILPRAVAIIDSTLCVDTSRNDNNKSNSAAAAAAATTAKSQADYVPTRAI